MPKYALPSQAFDTVNQDLNIDAVPLTDHWSWSDSQLDDVEMPAPCYHNLGFFFHNHFQMSDHPFSSEFNCSSSVTVVDSVHETPNHQQIQSYSEVGAHDLTTFLPSFYGNTGLPLDSQYFENRARSLSGCGAGIQEVPTTIVTNGDAQNFVGRRRFRTNFTEHQSMLLEQSFKDSHYPDHKTKRSMAEYLNIPEDRITVWFQNRRAKWRRKEHRQRDRNKTEKLFGSESYTQSGFPSSSFDANSKGTEKIPSLYELTTSQTSPEQFNPKLEESLLFQTTTRLI